MDVPEIQTKSLIDTLQHLASSGIIDSERIAFVASGRYQHGQAMGSLLAQVDSALANAESQSGLVWCQAEDNNEQIASSNADWKQLIEGAIETQRLRLVGFPVANQ